MQFPKPIPKEAPGIGWLYIHVNGHMYKVTDLAYDPDTGEYSVIHVKIGSNADQRSLSGSCHDQRSRSGGTRDPWTLVLTRTLSNFLGLHSTGVPRFTLYKREPKYE